MSKEEKKPLKWNFAMGLIHGAFFSGGRAFGDPDTILPVFLSNLTGSNILIGLSSALIGRLGGISGVLPQLFVASKIETRVHKKPLLDIAITIRALCWGLLALSTYFFAVTHPKLALLLFFILLTVFTFMGGVAEIPFMDIFGKAIPPTLRGKFFGYRQLLGGIVAIGSAFIAKNILGNQALKFPNNFALLFLLAFIFISISYIGLGSVKEPEEETHKNHLPFKSFLKKALLLFKQNSNYKYFLLTQIFLGSSGLAFPFYVLYARNVLEVNLQMVGFFLAAQMLGSSVSNFFWAYLSDSRGNKSVLQLTALIAVIIPLLAVIIPASLSGCFILIFLFIGIFSAGYGIGRTNFLLDIAPTKDRPTYISLNGTLTFPIAIYPLLGGILLQKVSHISLFMITILGILGGIYCVLHLKEPRTVLKNNQ
jgi:MFS family permease